MVLPVGEVESIGWWRRVISVGGGAKRWGQPPSIEGGVIEKMPSSSGPTFLLTEKSGRKVTIRLLPFDEKGCGRTLAELESEHLHTAFGGIQVEGRDLLLFFRQDVGERADRMIVEALASSDFNSALNLCQRVGEVLGRFHTDALARLALPNDERRWNKRLKALEERTYSNTLWRAPHSTDTLATITHRNFGLEAVHIDDNETVISCCHDGIPNAILPKSRDYPAIRDLAAAYRSIAGVCTDNNVSGDDELLLRKAIFDGWCSTAPRSATSSRALDGHRGGVAIWEYEQVLEEVAIAQAWGGQVNPRTTWWLGHVNRIQDQMYRSRTLSALSLLAGVSAPLVLLADSWLPLIFERAVVSLSLLGTSLALRWFYRKRAPPPY